jgi:hypothetical protein
MQRGRPSSSRLVIRPVYSPHSLFNGRTHNSTVCSSRDDFSVLSDLSAAACDAGGGCVDCGGGSAATAVADREQSCDVSNSSLLLPLRHRSRHHHHHHQHQHHQQQRRSCPHEQLQHAWPSQTSWQLLKCTNNILPLTCARYPLTCLQKHPRPITFAGC